MRIPIEESTIYHEAGHAAAFWFYGIPLEYVTIKPDLAMGYGGSVKTAVDPPSTGRTELENWMRAAAAGQAAQNRRSRIAPRAAAEWITQFGGVVGDLTDNPDPPGHDDLRNFVILGQLRDAEIHEPNTEAETGPAGWAPIWLEAEQLIHDKLWPAVQAIAEKLLANAVANEGQPTSNLRDLTGEEVATLAATAMADATSCDSPAS